MATAAESNQIPFQDEESVCEMPMDSATRGRTEIILTGWLRLSIGSRVRSGLSVVICVVFHQIVTDETAVQIVFCFAFIWSHLVLTCLG